MAAPEPKGGPAILIGFGEARKGGKKPSGGADMDTDSPADAGDEGTGAIAGEALASAIKSGDGQAIYDAFEALYKECQHGAKPMDVAEAAE